MEKHFENWDEASEYLLSECEKSCLNCKYGMKGKKTKSEFVFCTEPNHGMTMANLLFGICCSDWEGYDNDEI